MKVDFFRHSLTPEHAAAIAAVLGTPFLTSGDVCKRVEAQLRQFFGTTDALMANSWTNGAVATLLALGIGRDDEVIVPAMTFIATANVVELLGAKPVFVDVDPDTLLMSLDGVANALSRRTRAIIPVHLYGQMYDMIALKAILENRPDVAIVEDCAHCFEGGRDGYAPGAYSDAAIFSFYATKNVTCGEGGAVVTNRSDLGERIRKTRLHGMSVGAADRFKVGQYRHWDMESMGVKANLPDLLAVLLPEQIASIRERLPARQALADRYRTAFAHSPIRMQRLDAGVSSAEHLFPIQVPPAIRDEAIAALNANGVSVAVNYRAVPTLTYYREKYGYTPASFPVAQQWGEGTITLPLFPGLTSEEQGAVIDCVLNVIVPMCPSARWRNGS